MRGFGRHRGLTHVFTYQSSSNFGAKYLPSSFFELLVRSIVLQFGGS
jgi:hypothetical protein